MENPNKVSDWKGFWLEMLEALKRKIRSIGSLDPVVSELKDAVETSILASAEALEEAQDTKEAVEVLGSKMDELSQMLRGLDVNNISPEGLKDFQMAISEVERVKQNTRDTYHLLASGLSEPLKEMFTAFPSLTESDIEVKMLSDDNIHICIKSDKLTELVKEGKVDENTITAIYSNLTDDSRTAQIQRGYGDNVNVIVKKLGDTCKEQTITNNAVFDEVKKDLDKPTFEAETAKSKAIGEDEWKKGLAKNIIAETEKNNPEAIPELIDKTVKGTQETIAKEAIDKTVKTVQNENELGRRINGILSKVIGIGKVHSELFDTMDAYLKDVLRKNGLKIADITRNENGELIITQDNKDYAYNNKTPEVVNTLDNQPDTPNDIYDGVFSNKSNKGNDER